MWLLFESDRLSSQPFQPYVFGAAAYESYIAPAEKPNERCKVGGQAKTPLVTAGAEAVENAVHASRAAVEHRGRWFESHHEMAGVGISIAVSHPNALPRHTCFGTISARPTRQRAPRANPQFGQMS
jgi:4-aminobutyrate aminotransferase-like enzyme